MFMMLLQWFVCVLVFCSTLICHSSGSVDSELVADSNLDLVGSVVSYKGEVILAQNLVSVKVNLGVLRSFPMEMTKLKFELLDTISAERAKSVIPESQLSLASEIVKLMSKYMPRVVQQQRGIMRQRKRRSLIPVVGDILHGLFGVSTDGDISGISRRLQELESLAQIQGGMLEKSLGVVNQHGEMLRHLKTELHGAFDLIANRTRINFDAIVFGDRLNSLFTSCSLLVNEFRGLVDGLALAARGVVSQSILPYGELVSLVRDAQERFKFSPLFNALEINHYYSLIQSEIVGHFVFIHVPFTSNKEFSAYLVVPFPSLVGDVQIRLKGRERLVIVSKDLELMSFPSRVEFESVCFSNSHLLHVCPSYVMNLSPSHLHLCERDMVVRGRMGKTCSFERVNVTSVEVVHANNLYHLFFPFHSTISLSCNHTPARFMDVRGGYVLVDGCGLQSPELTLYPSNRRQFSYNVSAFKSPIYKKSHLSFHEDGLEEVLQRLEDEEVPDEIDDHWSGVLRHPNWTATSNVLSSTVFPVLVIVMVVVLVVLFRRHGAKVTTMMIDIVRSKRNTNPNENIETEQSEGGNESAML